MLKQVTLTLPEPAHEQIAHIVQTNSNPDALNAQVVTLDGPARVVEIAE